MCDHCAKITSRKGYAGQVTCRCNDAKKSDVVSKEKDFVGCCSKKEKKGGCCGAKCCSGTKEEHGGCCSDATTDQKSCCPAGK
ncbi:PREDICTED: S-adenosyl-L-methionine-dependent tRNA 4-demethylwyosine synthase-like isoform X2 [Trachymyrmex cornetzi]|uniref:S-adenosyl-L-methionine-dependent tRNA 4-demethylwyosine synthase-like isoform X2 n=1 Tax=Trachymyrmex cornetzi TaxID=471704 RepID=UPI00084EF00A|nr:PREDICTED: S-adenosyl-L-methionine-dependent tRNA 4-demethylwyosine synthase-like isoform X2 [Trachymyrmex cornetzi]